MLFKSLISFALALAAVCWAQEEDVKGQGCGCRKPSSSSSSSSHHHRRRHHHHHRPHNDCNGCSPSNSRKFVKQLQAEYNTLLQTCNFNGILQMAAPGTSVFTINPDCLPNTCCSRTFSLPDYLSTHTCGDTYQFMEPTEDNVKMYPNGTVVITQIVLTIPLAAPNDMQVYTLNYNWTPTFGCNFQLSYIYGNALGCPNFIGTPLPCLLCIA